MKPVLCNGALRDIAHDVQLRQSTATAAAHHHIIKLITATSHAFTDHARHDARHFVLLLLGHASQASKYNKHENVQGQPELREFG